MKGKIWKLRIFFWSILAIIVFWLFWMAIVPSGSIVYFKDFSDEKDEFILPLTPEERVELIFDGTQKIIGDPVYFFLRTPRRFEKAKMTIKYRNKSDLDIIETGVLMNKDLWQFDLKPIENKIVDQLSLAWDVIREGDLILLQRNRNYNSIDEFFDNLPLTEKIATYNYDIKNDFVLENYEASPEVNSGEMLDAIKLRGQYQFYTYIKNEDLDFNFDILDLNKNKGEDNISIELYYADQLIDSKDLEDDGVVDDFGEILKAREVEFEVSSLPEGVYKIIVNANDDIVSSFTTKQSKISFINKVWIYEGGDDLELFTDIRKMSAQTVNPGSLQAINFGDQALDVSETFKLFDAKLSSDNEDKINKINLEKNDVILSGNGIFSLSEDSYFNPNIQKIDNDIDINAAGIDYVIADYVSPQVEGDWKVAEINFDIANAYREFYKYQFLLSIPGLEVEDGVEDYIEVDEIKIELEGTSLWEKISRLISN